jgi:hypothetical protein
MSNTLVNDRRSSQSSRDFGDEVLPLLRRRPVPSWPADFALEKMRRLRTAWQVSADVISPRLAAHRSRAGPMRRASGHSRATPSARDSP